VTPGAKLTPIAAPMLNATAAARAHSGNVSACAVSIIKNAAVDTAAAPKAKRA
jgi:hypothetical protein